jgi:hypothetical protein
MTEKPLPEPYYPCADCYEDYSWRASELYWSEQLEDWYCENCWQEHNQHWDNGELIDYGPTLKAELKQWGFSR